MNMIRGAWLASHYLQGWEARLVGWTKDQLDMLRSTPLPKLAREAGYAAAEAAQLDGERAASEWVEKNAERLLQ